MWPRLQHALDSTCQAQGPDLETEPETPRYLRIPNPYAHLTSLDASNCVRAAILQLEHHLEFRHLGMEIRSRTKDT
jgi:hypothetical protein